MEDAKSAVNGVEYDVESDYEEPREIVDVKVDGGDEDDEDEEEQDGSGDDDGDEEEDGSDEDEDEDEDSDDDEDEEEDLGTEYLIQPVGQAEDEEDASDFEPNNENDVDEDIDEEEDDEEDNDPGSGRVEASAKRGRPSINGAAGNGEDDVERPIKR